MHILTWNQYLHHTFNQIVFTQHTNQTVANVLRLCVLCGLSSWFMNHCTVWTQKNGLIETRVLCNYHRESPFLQGRSGDCFSKLYYQGSEGCALWLGLSPKIRGRQVKNLKIEEYLLKLEQVSARFLCLFAVDKQPSGFLQPRSKAFVKCPAAVFLI